MPRPSPSTLILSLALVASEADADVVDRDREQTPKFLSMGIPSGEGGNGFTFAKVWN